MSKKLTYVYSTLAADNIYQNHVPGGADLVQTEGAGILIRGGAGSANRHGRDPEDTIPGTRNGPFSEDQMEYLNRVNLYRLHTENHFLCESVEKVDPEVAAADLSGGDMGRPLTPADYEEGKAPKVIGGEAPATEAPEATKPTGRRA